MATDARRMIDNLLRFYEFDNKTIISIGAGAAPGICAFIRLDFQTSYSIIVLSNIDYPEAMIIGEGIKKMLNIN